MDEVVESRAVRSEVLDVVALAALVGLGQQDGGQRVGHVIDRRPAAAGDQRAAGAVELHVVGGQPARGLGHRKVARRRVARQRGHGEVDHVDAEARAGEVGVLAVVERSRHAAGRVPGAVGDAGGQEVESEVDGAGVQLADDGGAGRVGHRDHAENPLALRGVVGDEHEVLAHAEVHVLVLEVGQRQEAELLRRLGVPRRRPTGPSGWTRTSS